MNWKEENPKNRHVDSITWEEAKQIAFLAAGKPEDFTLLKLDASCNGNNIPHVMLKYKYYEQISGYACKNYIGIFHNLNTYFGENFGSAYCQKELFEYYNKIGLT